LIDLFLAKAPHNLETLKDVDSLASTEGKLVAHSLVSTAGNLGASRLSQLALDLEAELAGADMHQIQLLQPQVLDELERAIGELTRLRAHTKGAPDEEDRDR
jgi:HPt (histidine-containing phosphotransfer) domain-containing protein